MLPFNNKKKVASVIVGNMNDSNSFHEEKPEENIDEHQENLRNLSQELHSSIQSGSSEGISQALQAFISAHTANDDQESEE